MPLARGLYVHIPFCTSRCDYCAFATWADAEDMIDAYVRAVVEEMRRRRDEGKIDLPSTLYFGGGTPSFIAANHIEKILAEAGVHEGAEVTVECNPESASLEKLKSYKASGINRVSLGVQSLSLQVLKSLGRSHDPREIYPAVDAVAQAGFDDYSVDLIYGAVGESEWILEQTIQGILDLNPAPKHISAYALTVEQTTPLAKQPWRHPNEDYQARAYRLIDEMLSNGGLEWYEISNWARPGYESRHNWNYWMQGEYLGVGCSAHSHFDSRRSWNIFNLGRYVSTVEDGRDPTAGEEELTATEKLTEGLQLLLRTSLGVPIEALEGADEIDFLVDRGEGVATLTLDGRLLANQVAIRLNGSTVNPSRLSSLQRRGPRWVSQKGRPVGRWSS